MMSRRYLQLVESVILVFFVVFSCCWRHRADALNDEYIHNDHEHKQGDTKDNYYIGTGIYDMTGPAADLNFMGYAKTTQNGRGIHMRLRARAYIIAEPPSVENRSSGDIGTAYTVQSRNDTKNEHMILDSMPSSLVMDEVEAEKEEEEVGVEVERWWKLRHRNKQGHGSIHGNVVKDSDVSRLDPETTICFVSMDIGMGSDLLNIRVLKRLEQLLPKQQGSNKRLCHLENLSLSGTHTHSAPGGFIQYTLYQITSMGFSEEAMNAYVEGVAQAILRAYNNLERGTVSIAKDLLFDANINRSPSSYLLNPQGERDLYADEGDTDKSMLLLKFTTSSKNEPIGMLNWFAVHGTSMNVTNLMISGDNKGYASYLMEKRMNGNNALPGQGKFVAAFASTNLGDVSPNTAGPKCLDTGLPCDIASSTCNGRNEMCVAFGPGKDMVESTEIIGRRQYDAAVRLFEGDPEPLNGEVGFRHSFVDMSNKTVTLDNGDVVTTCPAALGYSFAAGTTDGPGTFDFTQGTNSSNPFWNMIGGFLSAPDEKQVACQSPKPILLNTGRVTLPYAWDPASVPISVFRVGKLLILNVPAELSTMAGRRLRGHIKSLLSNYGIEDPEITIAGLANSYTHYVTTFEEYQGQRYEAASTLYGPHTLSAYIQEFERITLDLLEGRESESDNAPRDLGKKQLSLLPPVGPDMVGWGYKFGSTAIEPHDSYIRGKDTVFVSFRSANPRSNLRIEGTFLSVDFLLEDGSWETRFVDGDWSTRFFWKGGGVENFGVSFAEISWAIPDDSQQGIYRICHYGTRKTLVGDLEWMSIHTPDWLVSDAFGSMAAGFLMNLLKLVGSLSENVQSIFRGLARWSHVKDFEGCTRSFLVKKA